jgi:predicted small metal-binding protein
LPEQPKVTCPSCERRIEASNADALSENLWQHLRDEHDIELPPERVRENVAAQLEGFDGYNARPMSGS